MESKAAFNWCFIGAGTLASIVAKEILPSGRHRIAAVYTRRPQKCREFAGKYGGTAYDSAEAAISAPDVDGVYIVTPHTSHYEYAKLALSMGKPVLCEQPITVTAPEVAELFALAAEKGVYLAEAMWTWFSPIAQKVKQWYDVGEFGALHYAEARYHIDSRRYAARYTDPNLAGGALLDVGIYPITYLYRLFGKPTEIRCTGRLEGGIDLCEDVTMSVPNGLTCTASVSMCDFKGLEKIRLDGSKGRIRYYFFHNANRVKLVRKRGQNEVFKADGGYLNEFDMATGEIRGGLTQSLLVPPSATTDVMEILDECRRQMKLVYRWQKPIRNIGVRGSELVDASAGTQLSFMTDDIRRDKWERIDAAVDHLRERYGYMSVRRAVTCTDQQLGSINPKDDHTVHPVGYFGG